MSSPLRLFNFSNDAPAFFITHGLGGDIMEVRELIGHLRTSHPIYGLQWKGLNDPEAPHDTVGDMAQYFIDAIKQVQPYGPYILSGISSGGSIMFEVAIRLHRQGDEIAYLILLDTWPAVRFWPFGCWIESLAFRIRCHASKLAKMPLSHIVSYFKRLCRGVLYQLRVRHRQGIEPNFYVSQSDPPGLQRLRVSAIRAFEEYKPGYYPGKITFLKAEIDTVYPSDPLKIWGNHCSSIEIHRFPCEHEAMLGTGAEKVAAHLDNYISSVDFDVVRYPAFDLCHRP